MNPEKIKCNTVSTKILGSTTVSWAANQHIRMISEDRVTYWSNDAENSALNHSNQLHFKIYSHRNMIFEIAIIFHNLTVFTVFLIK